MLTAHGVHRNSVSLVYKVNDAREFLDAASIDADAIAPKVQDSSSARLFARESRKTPVVHQRVARD